MGAARRDWLTAHVEGDRARILRCDAHLRDALGLGHARDADARRALRLAAAEVVAVDARYRELAVKRTRTGWRLYVERSVPEPAYDGLACRSP